MVPLLPGQVYFKREARASLSEAGGLGPVASEEI